MLKEKKEKRECHFCKKDSYTKFVFDVENEIDQNTRRSIPVCSNHFTELCQIAYTDENMIRVPNYLSAGQKEYVAIKRLESHLNVSNTIPFKE